MFKYDYMGILMKRAIRIAMCSPFYLKCGNNLIYFPVSICRIENGVTLLPLYVFSYIYLKKTSFLVPINGVVAISGYCDVVRRSGYQIN